jgi:hypothetical protein
MGGFRRWSSVEAFELNSWGRGDVQDWTPLLGKVKRPKIVRSKSFSPTIVEEDDLDTTNFGSHDGHCKDSSIAEATDLSTTEVSTAPLSLQKTLPEVPHHVFDRRQKRWMVYIVSFAGLFSPLSSNIYFPALGNIARVGTLSYFSQHLILRFQENQSLINKFLDIPLLRCSSRSHHNDLYDIPRARTLLLGLMGRHRGSSSRLHWHLSSLSGFEHRPGPCTEPVYPDGVPSFASNWKLRYYLHW